MQDNRIPEEAPVNPVAPVIVVIFIVMIGIEGIFSLGSTGLIGGAQAVGWRLGALNDYAFSPGFLHYMLATGDFDPRYLMRFFTYAFVHPTFQSALIACVMFLALGKFVGEAVKGPGLALLFAVTTIGGALVFGLIAPEGDWLIGAFPATYGMIGAYSYLMWVYYRAIGENQAMAFRLIGILMALQLLFGLFFETGMAWIAEAAAFAIGFAVAPLVLPGGFARLRQKLQNR
ncbi:Membrane associated serine protease, rhomboid family [Pseudooceanicola antarcticus]|uniref:Membrane associated serine protease, rhomboid family n=1 Tax=Pseudooceanicola antarcticus TaxID=1247613 RepID=A0A285IRG3_9RHOB|nr:rhomboid family intramembrane serine protease [Pseudooceanicola antarcticus]PJE31868.1 rhomboid family intramembrane serine protease [Pseudooceanicola antarcticus]SNY50615.1 Membrane associated serine protease, rhomboid family [Pseudooceanicola antarcticus]